MSCLNSYCTNFTPFKEVFTGAVIFPHLPHSLEPDLSSMCAACVVRLLCTGYIRAVDASADKI